MPLATDRRSGGGVAELGAGVVQGSPICRRHNHSVQGSHPIFYYNVVDSTGLKVFGEGEWKVRKHGYSKRRTWRKAHLAMDVNTGQICAALMTHQDVGARVARSDPVRHAD